MDTLKSGATDYVLQDHLSRLVPVVRRALDEAAERAARRQAEQALASSQRFLQRVIDATPHVVVVFALPEQRILYVNRQVAAMLGYSPEQLQAMESTRLAEVTHPEDADRVQALVARLAAARDDEVTGRSPRSWAWSRTSPTAGWNRGAERLYSWPAVGQDVINLLTAGNRNDLFEARRVVLQDGVWTGILHQRTRDGRELVVQSSWTLVRDETGLPRSILVVNTDVTEMRKLEAKFLRSQRMESIGTLAGGIAHDLNNVLSPILMAVGLLRKQIDDARGRRILETLDTSAQRGADMIRQILTFARGAEGERVPLQPGHLIRELQRSPRRRSPSRSRCGRTWAVRRLDPAQHAPEGPRGLTARGGAATLIR